MSIYSLADLRAQAPKDLQSLDDVGLIKAFADHTGKDPMQVAEYLGYRQQQGMGSARVSAGVDNYQAGLLGFGEAAAGAMGFDGASTYLGDKRRANELDARIAQKLASDLGAVDDWRNVDGVGSAFNFAGGLAAQSLPYLGEAVVGGLAARGLMGGTRAALGAAREAGNAAEVARLGGRMATGQTIGGVAASYPSAVGDILQNQREENGTTNIGSALAGGVPYAALNAFGLEGMASRGLKPLAQFEGNLLARMGKAGAVTALSEGASETGQEMINQGFGRMAVNPNQTLFNEDANKRYVDSFVGGAVLGGMGGSLTGIRKPVDEGNKDLLGEQAPVDDRPAFDLQSYDQSQGPLARTGLGEVPLHVYREQILDGMASLPEDDVEGRTWHLERLAQIESQMRGGVTPVQDGQRSLMADVYETVNGQPMQLTNDEAVQGLMPFAPPGDTNNWTTAPGAGAPNQGGLDFSFTEGVGNVVKQESPEQKLAREVGEANAQAQAKFAETKTRASTALQKQDVKPQEVNAYARLEQAVAEKVITQQRMTELVANLTNKTDTPRSIEKHLEGLAAMRDAKATSDKAEFDASVAKVQNGKPKQAVQPAAPAANAVGTQPPAAQSASPAAQTAVKGVTATQPAAGTANTGAIAGIAANKTVTVGRKGREVDLTPGQLMQKMSNATGIDKARIVAATGFDVVQDPTTGAPRLVQSTDAPASLDQIAQAESEATGKRVTREAIRLSLLKYGITPNVITQLQSVATPDTVTTEELGIDPSENGSGYRVETDMSKATGQGLVEGETENDVQRRERQRADIILNLDRKADGTLDPEAVVTALKNANLYDEKVDGKQSALPTKVAVAPTKVVDLRNGNATRIEANIKLAFELPEASNAASDWDNSVVQWSDLPRTLQADWIYEYTDNLERNDGDLNFQELTREQSSIEDEYTTRSRQQASAGAIPAGDTGTRSGSQVVDGAESQGPEVRAEARPTTVVIAKKRRVVAKQDATETQPANEAPVGAPEKSRANTVQFSKASQTTGSKVADVVSDIKKFMRLDALSSRVVVVQSLADLPKGLVKMVGATANTQGFVVNGKAYLIADGIAPGQARAVFLHEVGAHLGMENLLGDFYDNLVDKIVEWSGRTDGSIEQKLAVAAMQRVSEANTPDAQANTEMVAYFIEEAVNAGITPSAMRARGLVAQVLQKITDALKKALTKLGFNSDKMTARDMVDIAYGAAHKELGSKDAGGNTIVQFSKASIKIANPPYLYKAPGEVRAAAEVVVKTLRDWTFTRGAFTTDILEAAEKMGIKTAKQYRERMNAAATEKVKLERKVSDILDRFIALPNHERNSVNALIKDSTMGNKWAFKPDWVPNFKSEWVDTAIANRYNALTPEARKVVEGVFRHGNDSLKEMQAAAMESIRSEVDPLIAQAKVDGDMKLVKELEREKVAVDGKFKRMFELRGATPYAPLRRFGNWAVVAKSQALMDAIARKDAAEIKKLEASGDHYQVVFTDGRISAKARENEIKAKGQWGNVEHFERTDDNLLYGGDSMFKAFSRFRTLARSEMEGEGKKVAGAMDKVLASMYMQLLSETSARNAEHQRKNVMGADEDMMKAFATHGRAMASFVGSLKTSGDVMDSLRTMATEARGADSDTKMMLYNEVLRRHAMGLDYEPNTLMDKALAANSFWSLVSSPSYILTNLTQPWVSSLPYMAGKWGYGKSFGELNRAYKDVAKLAAKLVKSPEAVSELPDDVRDAVQQLFDRGSIDISLSQDLGQFESGEGALNGRLTAILRAPRTAAERAEMVNRVATAVAAYRLAKGTMGADAATDYAQTVITRTHGDYTAVNAPRFMRSNVGRAMTQFRKFQLIQLSLFARMVKESLPSNMNKEERDVARRSLAYSLSTLFALGGVTALPGFTAISFVMGSVLGLGDDDTPDDPEATLRRLFGGGAEADFLLRGAPNLAGLNLSNRIGAAGMLSILPYTDLEASRNGYKDILLGLSGPMLGGTLPKALDGVGLLYSGDVYKGMEMLLPRGLADVLKGIRFADSGITKRNGDVVLSGEEIGALAGFAQAFGLPTTAITDTQMLRNTQYKADMFYKDRSNDIKRDYVQAYRSNDMESMAAARAQWMETQQARRALGYDVQPLSSLLKAPQAQREREAKPLKLELVQ